MFFLFFDYYLYFCTLTYIFFKYKARSHGRGFCPPTRGYVLKVNVGEMIFTKGWGIFFASPRAN
nr:MAG TPA: hypothetical protein [Caudoviricetes sp.]